MALFCETAKHACPIIDLVRLISDQKELCLTDYSITEGQAQGFMEALKRSNDLVRQIKLQNCIFNTPRAFDTFMGAIQT
jgi:hypothetical protein